MRYVLATLGVLGILAAVAWSATKPAVLAAPKPGEGGAAAPKAGAAKTAAPSPLKVSTFTVAAAPLAERITATGTLRADEGVELVAETNGKIMAITFREGTRVKQGDLLVKLNDADLRASVEVATRRRELAAQKESRLALLRSSGVSNDEEYESALSDLNVQKANVALAEALLAKTEIHAPFDGVIGLRFVSAGAFVTTASRIATLQKLDALKVDFSAPERYAGRIRAGTAISFTVPGNNRQFKGEIYAVDSRIDSATRNVLLRAVTPNPGEQLLPGGFANVEVTLSEVTDAVLVPAIAIIPGVSETSVFVVIDGKAQRRTVQIGTRSENSVQIISGLKPGELVIISGLQQLRAGSPVASAK